MGEALLHIDKLNSYYGKSHVLQDVSLDVKRHERVAVLGRNGMGKSTLMRSILGLAGIKREGDIFFKKENIVDRKTYQIARMGIAYVPQGWQLFSSLSVEEHLIMAYRPQEKEQSWTPERVFDVFPEIKARRKISGTRLSGGEQQILAIARALVTNPELILMDEPSEGISSLVIERIISICRELSTQKVSLLLVEQNLDIAMRIAQKVYILVNGRIVHWASVEEFKVDRERQQYYLGL